MELHLMFESVMSALKQFKLNLKTKLTVRMVSIEIKL